MDDHLLKLVEQVKKAAESSEIRVFYGYLAEESSFTSVHWNSDHGGDWKSYLECAKALSVRVLYVNWAPFEQFEIDESIEALRSKPDQGEQGKETEKAIAEIRQFQSKVGITCVVDLAFVANGVLHTFQETADWFDEFTDLAPSDDEDEGEAQDHKRINKAILEKWARDLASDPKYPVTKNHEYLLETIAGKDFESLPSYQVLSRAAVIYQEEYKEAADQRLAAEVRALRDQGLNLNAIAAKLGMSRDRVSGLLSLSVSKKDMP